MHRIGEDSLTQYMSSKSMKDKSTSRQKDEARIQSLKSISDKRGSEPVLRSKREVKTRSVISQLKVEEKPR